MSFDKIYYDNKKNQLEQKKIKKVFDFYNQTRQSLISIDQDLASIVQDEQELNKQIEESKKNEKTEAKPKSKVEKKNT